jgi:hypothetical protein
MANAIGSDYDNWCFDGEIAETESKCDTKILIFEFIKVSLQPISGIMGSGDECFSPG